MDWTTLIDIAIGVGTLIGVCASGLGAVWLFFRRRINAWWAPYKTGIKAITELPAMHAAVDGVRKDISTVSSNLSLLAMHVRARSDTNTENAEFEADHTGAFILVNQTFARWLGVGKEELKLWGWINHVHPDDRASVRREWDSCRAEHRIFSKEFRLVDVDRDVLTVHAIASPIPQAPPARQWIGVIRRVTE